MKKLSNTILPSPIQPTNQPTQIQPLIHTSVNPPIPTHHSCPLSLTYSPPSDVWLNDAKHVDGGFVELDEDSIVDLPQTQQLQNLTRFWVQTIDTANMKGCILER